MLPDRRAVVFDLDDTLYPYRRFVTSGFAAVAAHLARTYKIDRRFALRTLIGASRGGHRGAELQYRLERCGLPLRLLPSLIGILTGHQPSMTLPRSSVATLARLRAGGWRLGVLTNGRRDIQSRKVAALGVARYVDTVVYATEYGTGAGKPDVAPFLEVLQRLKVPARAAVFVGDDELCDVGGASSVGFVTVRCRMWRRGADETAADEVIDRLSQVPVLAHRRLEEAVNRHVA